MPKIARIELTSLEYVLEAGKGYGNARGVNNRRNCSLITLTTDDGVIGLGDAAGPLGVIREYTHEAGVRNLLTAPQTGHCK